MSVAVYQVKGMTCGHCAQAVTTEISKIESVTSVDVDLAGGEVTVHSEQPVAESAVREAVDEAGYDVVA
ncbi:MAG: heavy-metal-associated domain-containing protein [Micromonosporaceae bacterium]